MARMRKKAAIEIQFNWIFVLVAGALILSFFIFFVVKQKEASEQKLSASLIKDLETKITSARVSSGTAAELDLNDLEIMFSCEDYRITGVSESLNFRALFSPDRVKGKTMLLWSMPFSIPFKVTNLLFITSPDVKYVVLDTNSNAALTKKVYDRMYTKFLNVEMKDESGVDSVDISEVYKVKFVCFDCVDNLQNLDLSRFANLPENDVQAVSISSTTHSVKFFSRKGKSFVNQGESPYFGTDSDVESSMYASIFADSRENYDCNMNKALNSFRIVAEVYKQRMELIQNDSGLNPVFCKDYYGSPMNGPIKTLDDMIISSKGSFNTSMVDNMLSKSKELDAYQNSYIRRQSCPLIY